MIYIHNKLDNKPNGKRIVFYMRTSMNLHLNYKKPNVESILNKSFLFNTHIECKIYTIVYFYKKFS